MIASIAFVVFVVIPLSAVGLGMLFYYTHDNPTSLRTKWHMLFSREMPADLRAMEWILVERAENEDEDKKKTAKKPDKQQEIVGNINNNDDDNPAPRRKNKNDKKNTNDTGAEEKESKRGVLLVAFAGGGVRMGGIPLPEWRKTCSKIQGIDYLTVVDVHQKWYLQGHHRWRERFRATFARYERVVMIGNCMGASAALLFADMADAVIAFAPQTCLVRAKGKYWLNGLRCSAEERRCFNGWILERAAACPDVYVRYSPKKDTYFAGFLPEGMARIEEGCDEANVPLWMKRQGTLVPFVEETIRRVCGRGKDR